MMGWEQLLKILQAGGDKDGNGGASGLGSLLGSLSSGQSAPTTQSDHQMGLSMMTPYQNMSQPEIGLPFLMQLSQMRGQQPTKLVSRPSGFYQQYMRMFGGG